MYPQTWLKVTPPVNGHNFDSICSYSVARVPDTGDPIYGNTEPAEIDDKPKPVPVNRFSEYVTRLKREKNAGFVKQYKVPYVFFMFKWKGVLLKGGFHGSAHVQTVTLPI